MDLTPINSGINTNTIKTPEVETEIPSRVQHVKPLSFSNGVLKRHHPLGGGHHQNHHHAVVVFYKECMKNHAATMGGHAVDGCGEFMPSPTTNPTDPTSLKCAACGCHRNFHRREPEDPVLSLPPPNSTPALEYQPHHRHHPPPPPPPPIRTTHSHSSPSSPSPPPISSSYYHPSAPHMLLALSSGPDTIISPGNTSSGCRKRFRTKFSQDQKDKMLEFAEKIGWKIQRRDDDVINGFCNEVGVERGVLKVWMHNNKNTLGKKDLDTNIATTTTTTATSSAANISNGAATSAAKDVSQHVVNTNGSSSSS